jgi:tRNA synthetases class I (E and Q), catalytic domain
MQRIGFGIVVFNSALPGGRCRNGNIVPVIDPLPAPRSRAAGGAVVTRFAPSPMGDVHLGNARTALERAGAVYPCFCSPLELEVSRKTQLAAGRAEGPELGPLMKAMAFGQIRERLARYVPSAP